MIFFRIMDDTQEMEWITLQSLAASAAKNKQENTLTAEIIKKRLREEDAINILQNPQVISSLTPEIIRLCRTGTLPTGEDSTNEIKAKHFSTLKFLKQEYVECYCAEKDDGVLGAKAECSILLGGTADKEYYVALAHEINTGIPDHRGITVIARFDTEVNKNNTHIIMLTLWELYRTLAKLEDINMEQLLPVTVNGTPSFHNNCVILKSNKEHRYILGDIGNTILTIWPRYLEITLGHLGKYMPLEIHICIPRDQYNSYSHASTSLVDFLEEGIHKYITYPGVYNKHRRINYRTYKQCMENTMGIIPDAKDKSSHIVDLIKAGNKLVKNRVIALAAA